MMITTRTMTTLTWLQNRCMAAPIWETVVEEGDERCCVSRRRYWALLRGAGWQANGRDHHCCQHHHHRHQHHHPYHHPQKAKYHSYPMLILNRSRSLLSPSSSPSASVLPFSSLLAASTGLPFRHLGAAIDSTFNLSFLMFNNFSEFSELHVFHHGFLGRQLMMEVRKA